MSRRRTDLPIILSHSTRTGIMTFPNRKMGGRDVLIVGLNREVPSGDSYELQDIDWIKAVLHFSDVESLRVTVDCLTQELQRWLKERRTDGTEGQVNRMDDFKVGQYVIYHNGDHYELGRIKTLHPDGAFVAYHSGETGARTPYDLMHPLVNDFVIEETLLGGGFFERAGEQYG